ncbi:hypothetical protein [Azospira oryzae]|uniref:hypothetical protein n=1 Tax=Azospira oryzae TaxID=146939 RepID=UPI0005C18BA7|nr:hypothetical protein [Azospira oryzae]
MLHYLPPAILLAVLLAPPLCLARWPDRFSWPTRYALAALPLLYTTGGWQLGLAGVNFFACQGHSKDLHDCWRWGLDFTPLVDHGLFLIIPGLYIALPLSCWLLLNTGARQLGAWYLRLLQERKGKR